MLTQLALMGLCEFMCWQVYHKGLKMAFTNIDARVGLGALAIDLHALGNIPFLGML